VVAKPNDRAHPATPQILDEGAILSELEDLYRRRYAEFVRTATAVVGDVEEARDAVNAAFVALLRGRAKYRGAGALEAWVWRAVVNAARQHRRRVMRHRGHAEVPEEASIAEGPSGVDVGTLHGLIARLPDRQRLVLFLRYYADLDYATIGDVLNISSGTVGASLNAAQSTIRRALQEVRTQ
jgi:RNA polymerase sigma factor (sigma-70 family)